MTLSSLIPEYVRSLHNSGDILGTKEDSNNYSSDSDEE
jgi:hypothetical protein